MFEHCQNCLRPLTDSQSRHDGFGPECKAKLGYQQTFIDAARQAVTTGAISDSKLIVLGRILKRAENTISQFREDEPIPFSTTRTLRAVRADFEARARHLYRIGQLYVPEPEFKIEPVAA